MFPLSRLNHRGDLHSTWIRRFIARPLQLSGLHHLRRGHPTPSFNIDRGTRVLPLRFSPRALDRRSPGYLPAMVPLDAVFDSGVVALHLSLSRSSLGLRPSGRDRPIPKIKQFLGAMCQIQGYTLHLVVLAYPPF